MSDSSGALSSSDLGLLRSSQPRVKAPSQRAPLAVRPAVSARKTWSGVSRPQAFSMLTTAR